MEDRVKILINVLLDKTAREDERDDAAIDLRAYKDIRALNALIKIASDPHEEDVIVNNCAESIGEIFVKLNFFNKDSFRKMTPFAQKIVFDFIMATKPELINEQFRTELIKEFGSI